MAQHAARIVVMGVQGSGKTTLGEQLAARLGVPFIDGDDLHTVENKKLMASGRPLTDELRRPWLHEVGRRLAAADSGIVIACSALKREYRDLLRASAPDTYVVHPAGPIEVVAERLRTRSHAYMPPELIRSQYDTLEDLEPDEPGIVVDLRDAPERIVDAVMTALAERTGEDR